MKKILSLWLVVLFGFSQSMPLVSAMDMRPTDMGSKEIVYPAGEDFTRLQSLIGATFSKKGENSYTYNCIASDTLCPNYKYTSVVEKAIKLIVTKTYTGNEQFYATLFSSERGNSLKTILSNIPKGTPESDWKTFNFGGSNVAGDLLDASFGVNFSENGNSQGMLGAIETKINEMKRQKCQRLEDYSKCPWEGVSNIYLPTPDELFAETIYLNGESIKIESLKDEFEYNISGVSQKQQSDVTIPSREQIQASFAMSGMVATEDDINTTIASYTRSRIRDIDNRPSLYDSKTTYTLKYKKEAFTLDEAKVFLEKKATLDTSNVITSEREDISSILPCANMNLSYLEQARCTNITTSLRQVITALASYNISNEGVFPQKVDDLKKVELPNFPTAFTENFSYQVTKNRADYEIRYIGKIGEDPSSTSSKTDYKALLSGATVPEIPAIFAHAPADSMVLYVKNPANLIDLLNQKSDTTNRLSGLDVSATIKKLITTFFELQDFNTIEKNLKHEMLVVVNNLDATAPDIVLILSEADRDALSPTAKARVVGSKDGYIYVANSKDSLEKIQNLAQEKSLKNAPDFQYVWWKKSALIQDAFVFVGDAFFEKMITLESYLVHYRKYRDYRDLWSLQELVWAYQDAFGTLPTSFGDISRFGLESLTGSKMALFSLQDGLVAHKHIGTLKSTKTLPEAGYDLSTITRAELEDYKYNVQGYRDIWRANLDPMGIVLNRYGDGMEIDFFMTPVPSLGDMDQARQVFEGTMKESLSFVKNPKIRTGILSLVVGADISKIKTQIKTNDELNRGMAEANREILGNDKNILDYLGGEFGFTLGSLDPDIFEGWNVEKIDAALLVQVSSEEKGKELIDTLRNKMTEQMGGSMALDDIARSGGNMALGFLAKPLIEDYSGKKIYYLENISFPFVGKLGLAYTFVDDFFVIGLNRSTIKRYIDTANSGDKRKAILVDETSFDKHSFFAAILDGKIASDQARALYEKNNRLIPAYFGRGSTLVDSLGSVVSASYVTIDRTRRLGGKVTPLSQSFGGFTLTMTESDARVKLDTRGLSSLSGSLAEEWKKIQDAKTLPADLTTDSGIEVSRFLEIPERDNLVALSMIAHIGRAFEGSESLLRNTTLGMNLGDNEIGFRSRIFRNIYTKSIGMKSITSIPNYIWLILGTIVGLVLLGGVSAYLIRRKNTQTPSASPVRTLQDDAHAVIVPPVLVDAPTAPSTTTSSSESQPPVL